MPLLLDRYATGLEVNRNHLENIEHHSRTKPSETRCRRGGNRQSGRLAVEVVAYKSTRIEKLVLFCKLILQPLFQFFDGWETGF